MVDLCQFLSDLGLPQYFQVFTDHDVDGTTLLELEELHLKELGLSLGHRVKLMKAIAELRAASERPKTMSAHALLAKSDPDSADTRIAGSKTAADGERRQLTMMFVDL